MTLVINSIKLLFIGYTTWFRMWLCDRSLQIHFLWM